MKKEETKKAGSWLSNLLLIGSIAVTVLTFGYYILKVFDKTVGSEDVLKAVLYGILAPYVLTTISLYILKSQFEKVRSSFEDTNNDLVDKFSDEIIKPLKMDLINAIKPTAHYNVILNHPRKTTLQKFIPRILDDFERKLAHMSMGHIYEYAPAKYHSFASSMFRLAEKKIIATSAVDPTGFWDDPMTLSYLETNKELIRGDIEIIRYFFVNDGNKDASLNAIANNLGIGVKVYIIKDDDDFDSDYRIDGCLIDDYIAVIGNLDKKNNIMGVNAYIDDEDKTPFIRDWTKFLNNKKVEVLDVYEDMTIEEIIEKAPIPLRNE